MRFILLFTNFFLIFSRASSETVFWADLIENSKDGLFYESSMSIPFTGTITASEDNPFQGTFEGGLKHGKWIYFDQNGFVERQSEFLYGQLISKSLWADGQNIIEERHEYFDNGQLKSKSLWKNETQFGQPEVYYHSDKVCRRCGPSPKN